MGSSWSQEPRLIWTFWAAAAMALIGGAAPFLIGGQASRVSNVFIPFAVAALAFVACALVHEQGRAITSGLYLLAGLALVYGVLTMFALPLMLAVLGSCPAPPATCPGGLQHALTQAENTGIGIASGFGIGALFIGFFGLVVVYRRTAVPKVSAPPVRSIPPVDVTTEPDARPSPADENGAEPSHAATEPVAAKVESEEEPELPPHVEEERPELPPHESNPT